MMVDDVLSLAAVLGGVIVIVFMVMRSKRLPPLARFAIVGSAFGLFTASRYIEVDHSAGAIIWAAGFGVLMMTIAVQHLRAFPPAA
ncbi:hypothetical protein EWE75_22700 [Sphingomonas populi]|uniref:Uncharacterized protein n=1 Tax=Sphingomonas populi TaxID=2484750 RepID=A0A4Q6XH34_9SPHN|nr:hypothetical protein [Sphingomonas populi]RZF59250.1 hypothetical protein EWE75_22700 [Sphingomonas populi]